MSKLKFKEPGSLHALEEPKVPEVSIQEPKFESERFLIIKKSLHNKKDRTRHSRLKVTAQKPLNQQSSQFYGEDTFDYSKLVTIYGTLEDIEKNTPSDWEIFKESLRRFPVLFGFKPF